MFKRSSLTALFTGLLLNVFITSSAGIASAQEKAEKIGWKLGVQAWTFRNFTLSQSLDKIRELGLHYVEGYPGQKIGGDIPGGLDFTMDAGKRKQVLALLRSKGVKMMSYGVVGPKNHDEWVQLFKFAQGMGFTNVVAEPKPEDLAFVASLCQQYKINIAIHNHPRPSHYWSPDTLLAALSNVPGTRIGSCSDVGHWRRSGLDPVKCLQQMKGRIVELHLKDVIDAKDPSEETIWGQGGNHIQAVLTELHHQKFKGLMSIEYESTPEDNMEQIKKSIAYFNQVVSSF